MNGERVIEANGDNRERTTRSTKLWVVKLKKQGGETLYHVVDGVERSVCGIIGRDGSFVRYDHYIYPLHSHKRFKRLIKKAKSRKAFMWHFMGAGHEVPGSLDKVKILPFIIEGEQIAGY